MKTSFKRTIALIVITLLASGCLDTTQEGESSETFIQVNEFEATPNPVPSDAGLTLTAELENTGDADIEKMATRIFGPAYIQNIGVGERTREIGELRAESDTSFPQRVTWNIGSSNLRNLDRNREITNDIYTKIYYDYESRANTQFKFVTRERRRQKEYEPGDPVLETSEGPVEIGIEGTTPIIFDDGEVEERVCVTIENTADGVAFTGGEVEEIAYDESDATKNSVNLFIEEIPGSINVKLPESSNKEDISGSEEEIGVEANLIEGYQANQCFIFKGSTTSSEVDVNTLITAKYNYVEETSTSVTLEGTRY
jgi:hypothetical protein